MTGRPGYSLWRFQLGTAAGVEVLAPFAPEYGAIPGAGSAQPAARVLVEKLPARDSRLIGPGRPHPMEWSLEQNRLTVRGRTFLAEADLANLVEPPVRMQIVDSGEAFHGSLSNLLRLLVGLGLGSGASLLFHSCLVSIGERGVLFLGHSGAGKSTVGRLAIEAGLVVASDDLNAVDLEVVPRPHGRAFPWSGTFGPRSWAPLRAYPLHAAFFLEKAMENALLPMSGAEAFARLGSCAPFINTESRLYPRLFEQLERLVERVPVKRLRFRKDGSFWPLVERAVSAA